LEWKFVTMIRTRSSLGLLAVLALLAIGQDRPRPAVDQPTSTPPIEPWAEPGLKITRGLMLWLDAGRLNAAHKFFGQAEVQNGSRVDTWHDASGHGRHVVQPGEQSRPQYLGGALRFDGDATYLERAGIGSRLKDFTLFVVAAPLSNWGGFRAFTALHEKGREDFTTGVNVDQGAGFSARFEFLNVEGEGFGGMNNLLVQPSNFGVIRQMTVTSTQGRGGTKLYVDGNPARVRNRADTVLDVDRIVVGARFYGSPASIRGFLDGDIIQVLLYDRLLDDAERRDVESYLAARIGALGSIERPARHGVGKPLVSVKDPPPVQMLVPGFTARELPVNLTNINNVRYRPDGKLIALGYDGNIHLLSDRDGDGLEETVERFWENKGDLVAPIGMALTPPGYSHGDGIFVASKGKVSLIVDTDRDDKADKEIIVARGWKELPHGVDALGVAVDKDGHVHFGLGTTDYTNAYRVDERGRAAYSLADEHGTIQKTSPDFTSREIIATGIRFPVGLAFNRLGDLFATDQEGATWLANGNPFDELLHIQTNRHYGFPPRHPRYLDSVIDEPSVFDYAPQHQSTCGLFFNEPVSRGPIFGPAFWSGDALVTGYSRGKLFRTKLAKTAAGYIAQNSLIAVLNALPADACVSPRGDLVVAVHSGLPDWGSGPKGKGRLYKIAYSDQSAAQPVLAWAASSQEVRVAFDRPLDPARLKDLVKRASIEYGPAVRPGDRFESLHPPYEVVSRQQVAPRFELPILSAQVSADRRSLLFTTAPHPEASSYAFTLPRVENGVRGGLPQAAEVDLRYDLSGVDTAWTPATGEGGWSGWLPHLDLAVARQFTAGSAEHDRLWELIGKPGRLTLKTRVDLWQMLRPAVQPGSTLDYRLPDEEVTLTLALSGPIAVKWAGTVVEADIGPGRQPVQITTTPKQRELVDLEISMVTGATAALEVSWTTREDARPRALPLRRMLVRWAVLERPKDELARRDVPELKGGDWARGRAQFYGEKAKCAQCHKVRGRGGEIGPDLSNLIHRDYESVYRDVHAPSAAINPDFVAHTVALTDGRVFQGTLRTDGDRLILGDTDGRQIALSRSEVENSSPLAKSIMPEGLDVAVGPEALRDLLTFLLSDPLSPAKIENEGAPPPRRRAELDAALKGSKPVEKPRRLRIVLSAGPKDHGPGEHDYPLWLKRWSALLATDQTVAIETANGWPSSQQLETADVAVFYSNNPGWDAAKAEQLDRYFARGGGLVLIHYAVDGHEDVEALSKRIGLAWQGGKSAFRHGPLDLDLSKTKHPIARGITKLHLVDESYWNLVGDPAAVEVIATGVEDGRPRPLFWARQAGKGRVFVSIPGHYTWTFDDPLFRLILLRGMAWSADEPIDRFNELTALGARIVE
jgi:putative heme-binding domain-containing protein